MSGPFDDAYHPTLPSSLVASTSRYSGTDHSGRGNILPTGGQGGSERDLHDVELEELGELSEAKPFLRRSTESNHHIDASHRLLDLASPSESEADSADLQTSSHMNRKARNKKAGPERPTSQDDDQPHQNGDMGTPLEHRRKYHAAVDGTPAAQVASLISRDDFTLSSDVLAKSKEGSSDGNGFLDLPPKDRRNFLVLVLLYFLQGIPMGLATGSVPFLLKSAKYGVSYSSIGIFSLASYPYSLKLLWSPIVDAVWSQKIGRRKSWILPVQALSGLGMLWLGASAESMMASAGADGGAGIWAFTGWWFFLVFTCATQDIAVDGWAISILSQKHLAYASTAQTVGLTGGSFLSFTVFLAFSDPHFANRWFRALPAAGEAPLDYGLWTLGGYLTFWGWAYLAATVGLAFLKREDKTREREGILQVYKVMLGILKLKNIQTIIIIHLIAKIGFQANDAVTNLKLLDKGFGQDNMSLTVLIDFPFELSLGYYVGKWSSKYPPLGLWCWAFIGRLFAAAFAQLVVMIFPSVTDGVPTWYLLTVIAEHVLSTFMNTFMFVAISAFHAKIADPVIGGTYMTLLATVSNLGGTFPRFFVLKFVDAFTIATCQPPGIHSDLRSLKDGIMPISSPFSCVSDADKHRCSDGGGICNISVDGYYIMNIVCIVIGAATFWGYIRPKALMLQGLPLAAWRLEGGGLGGGGSPRHR